MRKQLCWLSDGGGIDARIMLPKAVHSDAIQTLTKQETPIKMYTYWTPRDHERRSTGQWHGGMTLPKRWVRPSGG